MPPDQVGENPLLSLNIGLFVYETHLLYLKQSEGNYK